MKKLLLTIITLNVININAQTFPVGHMSINFKDAGRTGGYSISGGITTSTTTGRDIGTEIYYPATTSGNNQPVANGQFPVVVFGHGFVMGWDSYDNIYNTLAAKGYIVLLPRTEGSFSPNHGDFGNDLKFLANAGLSLNTINTPTALAVFNGKILQKAAIGGHSMGAGSSYLAAANNSSIACLFNCAAATTNPSSISSASLVTVPTLVISGARDCVADTTVQNSHYDALASAKKFHIITKQLTHCDFGNGTNTNCTFGQGSSGCSNQVSNALAFPRYMNYIEPFLATHLKSDCSEAQHFMDSVNVTSSLRSGIKKQGSIACVTTNINNLNHESELLIYPNPTRVEITIQYLTNNFSYSHTELYDLLGKSIYVESTKKNNTKILNVESLENGIYILVVYQDHQKHTFKIIKN